MNIAHAIETFGVELSLEVRLRTVEYRRSQIGHSYALVQFEDATGSLSGVIRSPQVDAVGDIEVGAPVRVIGRVGTYCQGPQLQVKEIHALLPDDIDNASALLPQRLCPARALAALGRLVTFNEELRHPDLRGFLNRVMLDSTIGSAFLSCKASQSHHHAYPGGLLDHCTAGLDRIPHLAWLGGESDPAAIELTQLAYLLHDLGKIRTVGDARRPEIGRHVSHEHQTIAMLEPHLSWLRTQSPRAAMVLDYVFDYLARPADRRGIAKLAIADAVLAADHLDTASTQRRRIMDVFGGRLEGIAPASNDMLDEEAASHAA